MEPQYLNTKESLFQLIAIGEKIREARNIGELINTYRKYGNIDHPMLHYDFGRSFAILGDQAAAKDPILKGASHGLSYPCQYYETLHIDAIGQCLSDLVIRYPIKDDSVARKVSCLSYVYLSKCISRYRREAHDSYRTRALLFKDHEDPLIMQYVTMEVMGMGIITDPFIISDFYFASKATDSPYSKYYAKAETLHEQLGDLSIAGKDADEYSLEEMALIGEKRHYILFKELEKRYINGEFDLTIKELNFMNR
jgi:hypothetical protein